MSWHQELYEREQADLARRKAEYEANKPTGGVALIEQIRKQLLRHAFEKPFPKYVRIGDGCCLILRGEFDEIADYYRDAGAWSVEAAWVNGKLITESSVSSIDDKVLTEVSEKEWREDNKGYV